MDLKLKGKRAFVSGSSSGIGKGIALALAAEGCDMVVHGQDKARTEETAHEVTKLGVKSAVSIGDLTNDAGVALRQDTPTGSPLSRANGPTASR